MGPAHWDPKAISPFALPGVKKHRLFEELARSFCALDRQGKRAADGPGPDPSPVGGGMVPFSIFVVGKPRCKNVGAESISALLFHTKTI